MLLSLSNDSSESFLKYIYILSRLIFSFDPQNSVDADYATYISLKLLPLGGTYWNLCVAQFSQVEWRGLVDY